MRETGLLLALSSIRGADHMTRCSAHSCNFDGSRHFVPSHPTAIIPGSSVPLRSR